MTHQNGAGGTSNGFSGAARPGGRRRKAGLKAESLESRILLSATWADADVDDAPADADADGDPPGVGELRDAIESGAAGVGEDGGDGLFGDPGGGNGSVVVDVLSPSDASGVEDSAIGLDLGLSEIGGVSSVRVTGVPEGASLSAGVDNGDGSWTVGAAESAGLTITPPEGFSGEFELGVEAVRTETVTGGGSITPDSAMAAGTGGDGYTLTGATIDAEGNVSDESSDRVFFHGEGIGVKGDTGGPGYQLGFNTETGETEALNVRFDDPVVSADVSLARLFANEAGTGDEAAHWSAVRDGEVVGEGTVTAASGHEASVEVRAADGGTFDAIVFTAEEYAEDEGKRPGDSSDYLVARIDYQSEAETAEVVETGTVRVSVEAVADAPAVEASDASGAEDTAIALGLDASLIDVDGSETLSVTIGGLPEGASLSAGADNGDGTWTLTAAEARGVSVTPPADSDADFGLSVSVEARESGSGDAVTVVRSVPVSVEAVADAPTLGVGDGGEDVISVRVSGDAFDGDPRMRVLVDGVDVSGAVKVSADHSADEWQRIEVRGDFGGGEGRVEVRFDNDKWDPETGEDRNLYVDSIEVNGDRMEAESEDTGYERRGMEDIGGRERMAWNGSLVFDASSSLRPVLEGVEGEPIAAPISAALTDTDGSEVLSVTVGGLPEGASLSAGVDNGDGTWTLGPGELEGLTIAGAEAGEYELTVTAISTEVGSGDADAGPEPIDLGSVELDSYGGSGQDKSGGAEVLPDGSLEMTGNAWKSIALPTEVTEGTVLEFEFRAEGEAEIHGIGFDTNDSISANRTFNVHGTQGWGIRGVETYGEGSNAAVEGEWQTMRIPVGEHFTGEFDRMVFVHDHDRGPADAVSGFRNIRVFGAGDGGGSEDGAGVGDTAETSRAVKLVVHGASAPEPAPAPEPEPGPVDPAPAPRPTPTDPVPGPEPSPEPGPVPESPVTPREPVGERPGTGGAGSEEPRVDPSSDPRVAAARAAALGAEASPAADGSGGGPAEVDWSDAEGLAVMDPSSDVDDAMSRVEERAAAAGEALGTGSLGGTPSGMELRDVLETGEDAWRAPAELGEVDTSEAVYSAEESGEAGASSRGGETFEPAGLRGQAMADASDGADAGQTAGGFLPALWSFLRGLAPSARREDGFDEERGGRR